MPCQLLEPDTFCHCSCFLFFFRLLLLLDDVMSHFVDLMVSMLLMPGALFALAVILSTTESDTHFHRVNKIFSFNGLNPPNDEKVSMKTVKQCLRHVTLEDNSAKPSHLGAII